MSSEQSYALTHVAGTEREFSPVAAIISVSIALHRLFAKDLPRLVQRRPVVQDQTMRPYLAQVPDSDMASFIVHVVVHAAIPDCV